MRELRDAIVYRPRNEIEIFGVGLPAQGQELTGRDAIQAAFTDIRALVQERNSLKRRYTRGQVSKAYIQLINVQFEYCFSPYFRIIYTILKNIKTDPILSDAQKTYYGNLLRSQLSSHEVGLLGFNSCAKISNDLTFYLKYFRIFKYLPKNEARTILEDIYPQFAFKGRDD